MATQVIISHKTPAVVDATVVGLTTRVAGPGVVVSTPEGFHESAIVEIFSEGSEEFLENFAEQIGIFCETSLATTTVTSFLQKEADRK